MFNVETPNTVQNYQLSKTRQVYWRAVPLIILNWENQRAKVHRIRKSGAQNLQVTLAELFFPQNSDNPCYMAY